MICCVKLMKRFVNFYLAMRKIAKISLHKKWSFPLRISSVIATKSVVSFMENSIFCAVSVWSFWWKKFFLFFARKARLQMFNSQRDYFVSLMVLLKTKEKLKKKKYSRKQILTTPFEKIFVVFQGVISLPFSLVKLKWLNSNSRWIIFK